MKELTLLTGKTQGTSLFEKFLSLQIVKN